MRKQKQSSIACEQSAKTRVLAHGSKGIAPPRTAADATAANNNNNNNNAPTWRKRAAHMPIPLVFTACHRLHRKRRWHRHLLCLELHVFGRGERIGIYRVFLAVYVWKDTRYGIVRRGQFCFLPPAQLNKVSSWIWSLVLEKCCKLQHIALRRNLFLLRFRCFYRRLARFSVLFMTQDVVS